MSLLEIEQYLNITVPLNYGATVLLQKEIYQTSTYVSALFNHTVRQRSFHKTILFCRV